MILEEINETECKECGSCVVSERKDNKHTNGHFNEYRAFSCGRSLTFSPNFMSVRVSNPCKFSKNEIKKQSKREKAKTNLDAYINKVDVDNEFKIRLKNSYEYI